MIDIKKIIKGIKLLNNNTQTDGVTLNVSDSYSGNFQFDFPNTGSTTGQEIVTTESTQTLTNKTVELNGVDPNKILASDGTGTIVDSSITYTDAVSSVTLDITTAKDLVVVGKALRLPVAAVDPVGAEGDVIYNSTGQELKFYNSGGWQTLASSAAANQTLSNLLPTAINESLIPDPGLDLGSSVDPWDNAHITAITTDSVNGNTDLTLGGDSIIFDIGSGSDPGTPVEQQMYYNVVSKRFRYYDGTRWWGLQKRGDIVVLEDNTNTVQLDISTTTTETRIDSALDMQIVAPSILWDIGQASDPGSPVEQQMYYNTTDNKFKYYDGTSWRNVGQDDVLTVKYTISAPLATSNGSSITVNFDTMVYDTDSIASTGPFKITAPKAGWYRATVFLILEDVTVITAGVGTWVGLRNITTTETIKLDQRFYYNNITTLLGSVGGSGEIYLDEGDEMDIRFFQNCGSGLEISNNDSYVTITYIGA